MQLSEELINRILQYLATKPFNEVFPIIRDIENAKFEAIKKEKK